MLEVRFAPEAVDDLEQIFDYSCETWGFKQAEKYHDYLLFVINELSLNPKKGSWYPFAPKTYYRLRANRHLIFYTFDDSYCNIIRILHERMDVQGQLQ